jgi:hypothetical protein
MPVIDALRFYSKKLQEAGVPPYFQQRGGESCADCIAIGKDLGLIAEELTQYGGLSVPRLKVVA